MTSPEFITAFRDGAVAPGEFHHEDHVRLAYCHVSVEPLTKAIESFKKSLSQFLDRVGAHAKYHETITVAYILIIGDRLRGLPSGHTWTDFKSDNSDLLSAGENVLLKHYRTETLNSADARATFVEPDLLEIPGAHAFSLEASANAG